MELKKVLLGETYVNILSDKEKRKENTSARTTTSEYTEDDHNPIAASSQDQK